MLMDKEMLNNLQLIHTMEYYADIKIQANQLTWKEVNKVYLRKKSKMQMHTHCDSIVL